MKLSTQHARWPHAHPHMVPHTTLKTHPSNLARHPRSERYAQAVPEDMDGNIRGCSISSIMQHPCLSVDRNNPPVVVLGAKACDESIVPNERRPARSFCSPCSTRCLKTFQPSLFKVTFRWEIPTPWKHTHRHTFHNRAAWTGCIIAMTPGSAGTSWRLQVVPRITIFIKCHLTSPLKHQ